MQTVFEIRTKDGVSGSITTPLGFGMGKYLKPNQIKYSKIQRLVVKYPSDTFLIILP